MAELPYTNVCQHCRESMAVKDGGTQRVQVDWYVRDWLLCLRCTQALIAYVQHWGKETPEKRASG